MHKVKGGDALRHFIQYQVQKITETGSLGNRAKPLNTRKVPDEVAMQCAKFLKKGYFLFLKDRSGREDENIPVHLYYTSIKQACEDEPFLKAACNDYNVTPDHLLKRMHEADPNLKYYTLDLKRALTDEQMAARRFTAQNLYASAMADATFLPSIFWGDEFSMSFIPAPSHAKIKVYCDLHNEEVSHQVVHNPYASSSQPHIKTRSLIWVNAVYGPVCIEFMTGTTGIQRLFNPRVQPYMVSHTTALQSMLQ
jgi:hypothetical protein